MKCTQIKFIYFNLKVNVYLSFPITHSDKMDHRVRKFIVTNFFFSNLLLLLLFFNVGNFSKKEPFGLASSENFLKAIVTIKLKLFQV